MSLFGPKTKEYSDLNRQSITEIQETTEEIKQEVRPFSGSDPGLVPESNNDTQGKFLRGDGNWATPSGSGGIITSDDVAIQSGEKLLYDINHLSIAGWLSSRMSLVNGVFTFNAPSNGNCWADYILADSDLSSSDGIATVRFNVTDISGTFRVYLIFNNTSGKTLYIELFDLSTAKEYEHEVDINYLTVYRDYDGNGVNFAVANVDHTGAYIVIDKYDTTLADEFNFSGDNVTEALVSINAKAERALKQDKANYLAAPNGDKYFAQIKNDKSIVYVPVLTSNILYLGNSLLVGFGTHGMASATVNDDYYYKVNAYLTGQGKTLTTQKVSASDFEACTTDNEVNTWISQTLTSVVSNDRDLVIVQLGDNVNTSAKLAEFEKSCGTLLSYLRTNCPNARVAWVGMWYSSKDKLDIVKDACNKYGCAFVDISDLNIESNQAKIGDTYIDAAGNEQTITSAGVASHPNNKGFTAIVERIIETLFI